jgi:flagellar hook-basal body complex protein FliE
MEAFEYELRRALDRLDTTFGFFHHLEKALARFEEKLEIMATTQAQFDAILTPFLAQVTDYVTAAQAALAAAQAGDVAIDLTSEANSVMAAATSLSAAQAALPGAVLAPPPPTDPTQIIPTVPPPG